jgi:hypothetical protein
MTVTDTIKHAVGLDGEPRSEHRRIKTQVDAMY